MTLRKMAKESELKDKCGAWNAAHPIGTEVRFHPVIGGPPERTHHTESEAFVLGGHTAVIFLAGRRGCVALDAVSLAENSS